MKSWDATYCIPPAFFPKTAIVYTIDVQGSKRLYLCKAHVITNNYYMHVLRKVVHSAGRLEMIRKHDYRFKDEARGAEMVSWKRVAGLIAREDERIITR